MRNFIKKELIELIKDVSGFVSTRFAKINYEHLAACELTDAMLTNCLTCRKRKNQLSSSSDLNNRND